MLRPFSNNNSSLSSIVTHSPQGMVTTPAVGSKALLVQVTHGSWVIFWLHVSGAKPDNSVLAERARSCSSEDGVDDDRTFCARSAGFMLLAAVVPRRVCA